MASDVILEIASLHSGYGPIKVLYEIDFLARNGDFVAIMGPNGAGKSTLLRTIFGMCNVTRGTISYLGEDIRGLKSREILSRGASYVPQGRCNFPLMTVAENLDMATFTRRERNEIRNDLERVYELFPILKSRKKQLASNLSGGEQQVLELAMALLRRPKLLLIDEPSMGLAPLAIGWVFAEIQNLHRTGVTVLLVEQNTRKAMEVAERSVVMRLGRILWDGVTEAIDQDQLGEMFLTGRKPEEK